MRILLLSGALLLASLLTPPSGAAAPSPDLVRTVTYQGRSLTVRLHPVDLRAPGFEVLVQQPDGSLQPVAAPAPRSYLGSVDGLPSAVASGIVDSDGVVEGQIVFDRGGLWRFDDSSVYETRGLTQPSDYHWPSADNAALNVSVAPGQVGRTSYRWDIGFDLDNAWFTADPIGGSVAKAVDAVELAAVSLLDVYEPDALLRPAVGRVVIRASAAQDPYGTAADLGTLRTEWTTNQTDAGVDDVALFKDGGGGVAYIGAAGTDWGLAVSGGQGAPAIVLRHELGHTWGANDNHTNGPEGATIMSGNAFERFDGTELSAMMRYRDQQQRGSAPFTPVPRFTVPVPPYAALDLVDTMTSGVPYSFRPTANDHDANLDALALASVSARSHLGGQVTRSGDVVTYRPPSVRTRTVDRLSYVVRDATGRTATGIALLRVDPYRSPGSPRTWRRVALLPSVRYSLVNTQSGLGVAPRAPRAERGALLQRASSGSPSVLVAKRGAGYQLRSAASTGCWAAVARTGVRREPCRNVRAQRWLAVAHPKAGTSLVNVQTGRCLEPAGASVFGGARLVQVRCGLSFGQSWRFDPPPVSAWTRATTSAAPVRLRQVSGGLDLGIPDGAGSETALTLRGDAGALTRFTFRQRTGGTEVRNQQTDGCLDVYSDSHTAGDQVGSWSCHGGTNQAWSVLRNPAGGVTLRAVGSGLCLSGQALSGQAGRLVQVTCGLGAAQRWQVLAG